VNRALISALVILIVFIPFLSIAQWGDKGAEGGNGAGNGIGPVPAELESDAKNLRKSFGAQSFQELLDQQILGTLCENNNCGNLSETQAIRFLDRVVTYEKDKIAKAEQFESKWIARFGAVFTLFGLLIAWLAFRQSQNADRRSVRNQVEIEHLKKPLTSAELGKIE